MHDQVATIPTAPGMQPVQVLFTHSALYRLEREFGLTPLGAVERLEQLSPVAIEAVLLAGLEGHRERAATRATSWSLREVRDLLAGPLWELTSGELSRELISALTLGLRRGKAPQTPAPATP